MTLLLLFTLQILGLSSSFQIPTPSNAIGKFIYSTAPVDNDIHNDIEATDTSLTSTISSTSADVWDNDIATAQIKDLERLTATDDTSIHFHQNAKKMYDDVIDGTPFFVRQTTKTHLDKNIRELDMQVITESDMYDIVKKITPKPFLKHSLDILDGHKSPPIKSVSASGIDIEANVEEESASYMIHDKELYFEQNSKLMYDKVLDGHPLIVRHIVERNLNNALAEKCTRMVCESDLYQVIKQESPKALLDYNLMILDKYCTGMSLEKHFDGSINSSTMDTTTNSFVIAGKEFVFQQNAKLMYDMTLEGTPQFIRKKTNENLDSAILEICDNGMVSENDMYDVVKKATVSILLSGLSSYSPFPNLSFAPLA